MSTLLDHPAAVIAVVVVLSVGLLACAWVWASNIVDQDQEDADEEVRQSRLTIVR